MKNKIIKLLSIFLVIAILLSGGYFFDLNKEAEAKTKTTKICNHTTITVNNNNTYDTYGMGIEKANKIQQHTTLTIETSKGSYYHKHTRVFAQNQPYNPANNPENPSEISYYHLGVGVVHDDINTKNGNDRTEIMAIYYYSKIKYKLPAYYRKTTTYKANNKKSTTKTAFENHSASTTYCSTDCSYESFMDNNHNCKECKMQIEYNKTELGTFRITTPCCGDTVLYHPGTGIVNIYKKQKICSHTSVVAEEGNNKNERVVKIETQKGSFYHSHRQYYQYSTKTASKIKYVNFVAHDSIFTESSQEAVDASACSHGYCDKTKYNVCSDYENKIYNKKTKRYSYKDNESSGSVKFGKSASTALKNKYKCSHCKMRSSESGQTIIMTTKCCGDTVKVNVKTGKVEIIRKK